MAGMGLVTLSKKQVEDAKTNLENLDKIIRNGPALIDAGAMTAEDIKQAKDTKALLERTLATYPHE